MVSLVQALRVAQATIERLTVDHGNGFTSSKGTLDVIRDSLAPYVCDRCGAELESRGDCSNVNCAERQENKPRYFVIPDTQDGCSIATFPDPMPLEKVGEHIAAYLKRFEHQGYFSNCKRERIPLGEMAFYVVPQNSEGGYFR